MTAPSQFTVGTPVTYRNIEPRSTATIDATVVKVGRKWVYIDGDSVPWYIAAMAFDKLTGLSKEDYRGTSYERIETVEMRTAREHRERAELAIRDCWPMRGNDRLPPLRGLTTDQIERITAILTEEAK